MIRTLVLLIPVLVLATDRTLSAEPTADHLSDTVKFLSFNIRYGTANDGPNAWPLRREMVFQVIRDQGADFIGLQEALRFQIDQIRQALPEYEEHGVGRDDGRTAGEYSSILYRKDRWTLLEGKTQWLSDTPDLPGSRTWGNLIPRIVTWGRFRSVSSDVTIHVINSHFDHISQPAREKSSDFIAMMIDELPQNASVVVLGDFNAGEDNPAIASLKSSEPDGPPRLADTFRVLHPDANVVGTFNGFQGTEDGAKIDYILTRPSVHVLKAEIIKTQSDGRFPSDHFPVNAELRFQRAQ